MSKRDESHNLDFLRTVAVTLVFSRHLYGHIFGDAEGIFRPQLFGVLGVWFFFVHTSLVLMFSLEKQAQSLKSKRLYFAFLMRRAFRIFPLSVVTIGSVLLIALIWRGNPIASANELSHGVVVSNIFHYRNVIGPLWSLPVEFQMYLLLPLLWMFGKRFGWKWIAFGAWPLSVVVAIALNQSRSLTSIGAIAYAPCFVPGVLCYFVWKRARPLMPFMALPILLICLLAIYLEIGRLSQTGGAWVVCLVLGSAIPWIGEMKSHVLRNVCRIVARYSFGIYLFHEVCIPIIQSAFATETSWMIVALASVMSTAAVSFVAYHAIEAPMVALGVTLSRRIFHGVSINPRQVAA